MGIFTTKKNAFSNNSEIALQNCQKLSQNFLNNFKPLLIYQFHQSLLKSTYVNQNGGDINSISKQMVKIINNMDTRHVIDNPESIISKNGKIFFRCNGLILHNLIHNLLYLFNTKFITKLTNDNYKTIELAYYNNKSFNSRPLIEAIYQTAKNSGYSELTNLEDIIKKLYDDLNSYQALINHTYPFLSEKQKETRIPIHKLIPIIENNNSNNYIFEYLKILIKTARKLK